ncbi:unnamed protein product [Brugia timori]|uniref:Biogenesis of lysosome-related organelles complex 1 subunit 1 n=1 Tax=Brugia timori TaxID=42155 RepID=A0A0R3QAW2_9BILA|nr:unnamed protein product [Brugia timori]
MAYVHYKVTNSELKSHEQFQLSVHEQLAEVRKTLQSRQIEFNEAKKKIVNEVAVKFSILVEQWENLKKCQLQLRDDEKLLREALNNFTDD